MRVHTSARHNGHTYRHTHTPTAPPFHKLPGQTDLRRPSVDFCILVGGNHQLPTLAIIPSLKEGIPIYTEYFTMQYTWPALVCTRSHNVY